MWILWTEMVKIGGWGVGGCTTPKNAWNMGVFGWKCPPISMKNNPPFSTYDGLQNSPNDNENVCFVLRNYRKTIILHTSSTHLSTLSTFFNNSNILFDIPPYHIWYTVPISRTYRHICTLCADVIINAYGYDGNGQFAISKKVLPNICSWRYTIATRLRDGKQPEPTVKAGDTNKARSAAATVLHARHKRQCSLMYIGSTA